MPQSPDHTVTALRRFAGQLPQISQLPTRTAQATGLAIRSVLNNVTPADDLDTRTIDADDLLDQFDSATADQYTANTRSTYRAGFHRGLGLFERWQGQDPAWDSDPPRRARRRAPGQTISHTFPVRAGITTRFVLPVDLTDSEAERLITFIRSLVVPPHPPANTVSGR